MSHQPAEPTPAASPFTGFSRLVRILGQFVAPTSLLAALLFYFGWAHVYWFFDYFGVDSSVLAPSTREYVIRSVDSLFIPLIAVAIAGLALMWGYIALPERVRRGPSSRRHLAVLSTVSVLVLLNGLSRLVIVTPFNRGLCVAPICIIVGVALLWYLVLLRRSRLRQKNPTARRSDASLLCEWAVMFILVSMSLFWIATDYSVAVGETRARQAAAKSRCARRSSCSARRTCISMEATSADGLRDATGLRIGIPFPLHRSGTANRHRQQFCAAAADLAARQRHRDRPAHVWHRRYPLRVLDHERLPGPLPPADRPGRGPRQRGIRVHACGLRRRTGGAVQPAHRAQAGRHGTAAQTSQRDGSLFHPQTGERIN